MVLEEMSWHLRYYEYSYMYYIVGSMALCLTYTIIYCVKMPVNKIKNLRDVIDFDPQINEGLFEIIRAGEQGGAWLFEERRTFRCLGTLGSTKGGQSWKILGTDLDWQLRARQLQACMGIGRLVDLPEKFSESANHHAGLWLPGTKLPVPIISRLWPSWCCSPYS